jgi:hypothetical protein
MEGLKRAEGDERGLDKGGGVHKRRGGPDCDVATNPKKDWGERVRQGGWVS